MTKNRTIINEVKRLSLEFNIDNIKLINEELRYVTKCVHHVKLTIMKELLKENFRALLWFVDNIPIDDKSKFSFIMNCDLYITDVIYLINNSHIKLHAYQLYKLYKKYRLHVLSDYIISHLLDYNLCVLMSMNFLKYDKVNYITKAQILTKNTGDIKYFSNGYGTMKANETVSSIMYKVFGRSYIHTPKESLMKQIMDDPPRNSIKIVI